MAEQTFRCPDCDRDRPVDKRYIFRFKDERVLGALGRARMAPTCEEGDKRRCVDCHKLRSRSGELIRRLDVDNDWGDVDKASKAKFMQTSCDLFGDALARQITMTLQETRTHTHSSQFACQGGFFDEQDMTNRYVKKPEQLKNIFDCAPTMVCPVRKVKLWQDPAWSLTQTAEENVKRESKREATQALNMRAAKKKKVEKELKEPTVEKEAEGKPLAAASLERLTKAKVKVEQFSSKFSAVADTIDGEGIRPHIPNSSLRKLSCRRLPLKITKVN